MDAKLRKRQFASHRSAHVDRGLVFSSLAPLAFVFIFTFGESHLTLTLHANTHELRICRNINFTFINITVTDYESIIRKVRKVKTRESLEDILRVILDGFHLDFLLFQKM
jgi:hypothetical protein